MANTATTRRTYSSTDRVMWSRWILGLIPLGIVATTMAWGLHLVHQPGGYAGLFWTFLLMWPLAGMIHVLVEWAHCRNRLLAAGTALLTGAAAFCGHIRSRPSAKTAGQPSGSSNGCPPAWSSVLSAMPLKKNPTGRVRRPRSSKPRKLT